MNSRPQNPKHKIPTSASTKSRLFRAQVQAPPDPKDQDRNKQKDRSPLKKCIRNNVKASTQSYPVNPKGNERLERQLKSFDCLSQQLRGLTLGLNEVIKENEKAEKVLLEERKKPRVKSEAELMLLEMLKSFSRPQPVLSHEEVNVLSHEEVKSQLDQNENALLPYLPQGSIKEEEKTPFERKSPKDVNYLAPTPIVEEEQKHQIENSNPFIVLTKVENVFETPQFNKEEMELQEALKKLDKNFPVTINDMEENLLNKEIPTIFPMKPIDHRSVKAAQRTIFPIQPREKSHPTKKFVEPIRDETKTKVAEKTWKY